MPILYPARQVLAQLPTPLQPLDRLTDQLSKPYGGPRIWVKRDDLTESAMSGNKLRKLEFIVAAAKEQGCDTLITCGGLQSNHCRATALVGARMGMRVQLILRDSPVSQADAVADGNLLVDHLAGAAVAIYPPREYQRKLPKLFELWQQRYADSGSRALCIPTGGSDGLGIWGYIRGAEELLDDCRKMAFSPEQIICASGSGGTQAGLTLGCHLLQSDAQITGFAVCDDAEYFQQKVRNDIYSWVQQNADLPGLQLSPELLNLKASPEGPHKLNILVNDQYIGPGYGIAGREVYQTIATAARLEGLLLDPVYSAKAFHGMLEELKKGTYSECQNLVFVHTGGQFGLFPHRDQFQFLTA